MNPETRNLRMNTFTLSIITPEKTLFSGQAEMVVIPGELGEMGILAGHMPLISSLRDGDITITRAGGATETLHITGGVAEITPETCVVLAEGATAAQAA